VILEKATKCGTKQAPKIGKQPLITKKPCDYGHFTYIWASDDSISGFQFRYDIDTIF